MLLVFLGKVEDGSLCVSKNEDGYCIAWSNDTKILQQDVSWELLSDLNITPMEFESALKTTDSTTIIHEKKCNYHLGVKLQRSVSILYLFPFEHVKNVMVFHGKETNKNQVLYLGPVKNGKGMLCVCRKIKKYGVCIYRFGYSDGLCRQSAKIHYDGNWNRLEMHLEHLELQQCNNMYKIGFDGEPYCDLIEIE